MEEVQDIIAVGAGASSKFIMPGNRYERAINVKSVSDYIERTDEMIKRKYTVPSSVADKIMDIYRKNRIADWCMLKENDDISLDVPTTSVQFITCDGEFVFSNETELPKKSEGVIKEIYDVLSANIKTELEKGED